MNSYSWKKYAGLPACLSLFLGALCLSSTAAPAQILSAQTETSAQSNALPDGGMMIGSDTNQMPDVTSSSYVLAPSDELEISVVNQPDLHQPDVPILQDGTISFGYLGTVKAAGLTVAMLKNLLTKGLSGRYNQPEVTVMVRSSHTRKINVAGIVHAPGAYDYRPGLRLLDVITLAGGSVNPVEQTQVNVISDGGNKNTPINFVKLMNVNGDFDPAQNLVLSPGDSVLLSPKDPEKSMIKVSGEVQKPGQYGVVTDGITILALLTEAGGTTPMAALTKAQIVHNGQVQLINLHPTKYDLNDPAGQTKLVAGDTLFIPVNNAKYAVLGEVRQPTEYLFPDGEDVTLTQAIAVAGGPTTEGDQQHLGILRHDPKDIHSDKRVFIMVNIKDMLANKNAVADPAIEPGDILVVPTRRHTHSPLDFLSGITSVVYNAALLGTRL